MNVPILDLKRQYEGIKEEVEAQLLEVARSGYYVMGPKVADFEKEMEAYLGVKHVISTANGTDSLVIALKSCGIGQGDEVITTPFLFLQPSKPFLLWGQRPFLPT